jgi:DNA-binding HxlR family transcriptional regulator
MTRTHEKVRYRPAGKPQALTPTSAAEGVERAFQMLEGRWKMLIQQLRQLEADGIVQRIVHQQVPPKVEYRLTEWGQALCPALDAVLKWAALHGSRSSSTE